MKNILKKLFRPRVASGEFVGRQRFRDISFLAQSPSGIIGRVTRSVPAPKTLPVIQDPTNPVTFYGLAVINTAQNTGRNVLTTDGALTRVNGFAAQPYPFQAQSTTNYGAQALQSLVPIPTSGQVLSELMSGPISVYCNSATAAAATQATVPYVWIAASTGTHVQGGCETTPSASAASVAGANTGNGTLGTLSVTAGTAMAGAYTIKFTAATAFQVLDPNGKQLATGATGVAYNDAGLLFTITAGGTAFVAGDSFTVTVTNQTIPVGGNSFFFGPGDSTGQIELFFNI